MSNKPKYIEDLEHIRDQLRHEREEHFKNISDPRKWTEMEKDDQRYHDGVEQSCAEMNEKHGKGLEQEWTESQKANQRYVDGIRSSFAEFYEMYGDPDEEQKK